MLKSSVTDRRVNIYFRTLNASLMQGSEYLEGCLGDGLVIIIFIFIIIIMIITLSFSTVLPDTPMPPTMALPRVRGRPVIGQLM